MHHNGHKHPAKSRGLRVRSNKVEFSLVNRVSLIFKGPPPGIYTRSACFGHLGLDIIEITCCLHLNVVARVLNRF